MCSASWLGFTAHWEIKENHLYLVSLRANPCSDRPDEIPLQTFFPGASGPIAASWFTGRLVIPRGKQVEYVHMGYMSRYERYIIVEINAGRITSREEVKELPNGR